MNNLDLDRIARERFLSLSIDNNLNALNSLVNGFFASDITDLSYSSTITFRNTNVDIHTITVNSIDLISEMRTFDQLQADIYLDRLRKFKLFIDCIDRFNSELIQIEDCVKRNKKTKKFVFNIYELFIRLFEIYKDEFGFKLFIRFRDTLISWGADPVLVNEDEFNYETVSLLHTLFAVSLGIISSEDTLSDISVWSQQINELSSGVSLETLNRLHKFLKNIIGKRLDVSDFEGEKHILYKYYWALIGVINRDEDLISRRNRLEKGLIKFRSIIDQDKVYTLQYIFFKNIYDSILELFEINDIELVEELKDDLINYLLFAKGKYMNLNSNSERNNKRINYINNILELLNDV